MTDMREIVDELVTLLNEHRLEIQALRHRVIELEARVNAIQDRQDHPYRIKPAEEWKAGGSE